MAIDKSKIFVFISVLVLTMNVLFLPSSWASKAHLKPESQSTVELSKETAEPAPSDPEQQPLSIYEAHHEQARQASGRSIGRLLLGLFGVLALLGLFARWGLPRLVAHYPQFFEYWQRHGKDKRTDKELKGTSEAVSIPQAELPEHASLFVGNSGTGALRLVSSTLLNTSQELHLVEVGDRQLILVSTAEGVSILCDLEKPPKDSVANRVHTVEDLFPTKSSTSAILPANPASASFNEKSSDISSASAVRPGLLKNTLKTFIPPIEKKPSGWVLQSKELRDMGKAKPYARPPQTKSFSKLISKVPQKANSMKSEMSIELLGDYDDIF